MSEQELTKEVERLKAELAVCEDEFRQCVHVLHSLRERYDIPFTGDSIDETVAQSFGRLHKQHEDFKKRTIDILLDFVSWGHPAMGIYPSWVEDKSTMEKAEELLTELERDNE